jgi:lipoyl(octanoyl) transferase
MLGSRPIRLRRYASAVEAQELDLGRMPYRPAFELQAQILDEVASGQRPHTLIFVEHDPVLTLGANFHESNLLYPPEHYERLGIAIERTDRGGDVTYHGPKQLVIYPIFRVSELGRDLHKWLRDLEETMIAALRQFGLEGYRFPPHTGVWTNGRKIAAIGIKVKKWVSMHGIALNCDNDLAPFQAIIPCGIADYGVTSLTQETGRGIGIAEAKPAVRRAFEEVFRLKILPDK